MAETRNTAQGQAEQPAVTLTPAMNDALGLVAECQFLDPMAWLIKQTTYDALEAAGLIEKATAYQLTEAGKVKAVELHENTMRQFIREQAKKLISRRPELKQAVTDVVRRLPKESEAFLSELHSLFRALTDIAFANNTESAVRRQVGNLKLDEAEKTRFKMIVASLIDVVEPDRKPAPAPEQPTQDVQPLVERLNRLGKLNLTTYDLIRLMLNRAEK